MVTYLPQIEPVFNILTGGQLYLLHVSNVSTQKYEKKTLHDDGRGLYLDSMCKHDVIHETGST